MYSVFRIQSARLRYWRHIVFGFSHTFGSFTLLAAHCIRFFAYIWLVYVTGGTLYSVFRIHLSVSSTKTCISEDKVRSVVPKRCVLIENRAPHGPPLNIGPSLDFVSHFSAVSYSKIVVFPTLIRSISISNRLYLYLMQLKIQCASYSALCGENSCREYT